jgi:hypothetical protein
MLIIQRTWRVSGFGKISTNGGSCERTGKEPVVL